MNSEFIHTLPTGEQVTIRLCRDAKPKVGRAQLYCSRDGRFFSLTHRSISQVQPCLNPANCRTTHRSKNGNSGGCYPKMRYFGNKRCHTLVCTAWHGERPPGYECDHLNADMLNWHADNLEWVTRAENIRRAKRIRALRKMGMDTTRLTPDAARSFFDMREEDFIEFTQNFVIEH